MGVDRPFRRSMPPKELARQAAMASSIFCRNPPICQLFGRTKDIVACLFMKLELRKRRPIRFMMNNRPPDGHFYSTRGTLHAVLSHRHRSNAVGPIGLPQRALEFADIAGGFLGNSDFVVVLRESAIHGLAFCRFATVADLANFGQLAQTRESRQLGTCSSRRRPVAEFA